MKEYRHNLASERAKVVNAVQISWDQIQSLSIPLDLRLDDSTTISALQRFQTQCLDGYDLLILESISRANPGQIRVITDDADYVTSPSIQVFTCNPTALMSAQAQGKLLTSR
jgi:hypothetical protein